MKHLTGRIQSTLMAMVIVLAAPMTAAGQQNEASISAATIRSLVETLNLSIDKTANDLTMLRTD